MNWKILLTTALTCLSFHLFAQQIDALGIKDSQFVPVFIGGWGSCDSLRSDAEKKQFGEQTSHQMFLYQQAIRYVQTINSHARGGIEKMVLICANKWSQSGFLAQGEIRLQSYSVRGDQVSMDLPAAQIVNIDSYQDNSQSVLLRPFPKLDQRPHLTTKLLELAHGRPMVLFGHSYGSWIGKRIIEILAAPELYKASNIKRNRQLAADSAKLLKSYSQFPVHTFFSLEGISAESCRIEKSIFAGLETMINSHATYQSMGCRQETKSFDDELNWYNVMLRDSTLATRAMISTTSGIQNIFLDVMPFGEERDYKKSQMHPFKNAHHMLGFSELTWNTLCELSLGDQNLCRAVNHLDNKGRSSVGVDSK